MRWIIPRADAGQGGAECAEVGSVQDRGGGGGGRVGGGAGQQNESFAGDANPGVV